MDKFAYEICELLETQLGWSFGDGSGKLKVGELIRGEEGVFVKQTGSPEPDRYTPIETRVLEFWAVSKNTEQALTDLGRVYDLFHQNEHYNTTNYQIYYSNVLGQIDDMDRDGENRKLMKLTIEFIIRSYSFGTIDINTTPSLINHSGLSELDWSEAGHSIDTDIPFNNNSIDSLSFINGGFKTGSETDYSRFETDGTIVFNGDATVWKDINVGGVSLAKGASNQPSLVNLDTTNILAYEFSASQTNELNGSFELQHDYKEGSDIVPHLHWYPTNTNTGDVRWGLEYYIRDGNSVKKTGTVYALSAGEGIAWQELRTDFENIDGTELGIGNQIHFRLFRDGTDPSDDYNDGAVLATFGIHYEVDTIGSRQIINK